LCRLKTCIIILKIYFQSFFDQNLTNFSFNLSKVVRFKHSSHTVSNAELCSLKSVY
jgi:hypothetical protein